MKHVLQKLILKAILCFLGIPFCLYGCLEEIDLQSKTSFENILVVEATITNEFKKQKVNLSRSYRLESNGPIPETGAEVKIIGSDNSEYLFQETQTGTYLSNETFAALPDVEYKLLIYTNNGRAYESSKTNLNGESVIANLTYEIGFNENNENGISIFVEPLVSLESSEFYRYTYEETYKIVAPLYSNEELIPQIVTSDFPFNIATEFQGFTTLTEVIDYIVVKQFRDEQKQVCYNSVSSLEIMLANTNDFNDNSFGGERIRFITKNNYIISHRYSILARQYGQSQEAHIFYNVLSNLSENENLFSVLQPGFLNGNVYAVNDSNEKVAGFFEVSSVDEQRLYFNYEDVFPEEDLPPYAIECNDLLFPVLLVDDGDGNAVRSPLIDDLDDGKLLYLLNGYNDDDSPFDTAPFIIILGECGDCTLLGNNMPPEFWEE